MTVESLTTQATGAPRVLLVTYPASGQVASIDFNTGTFLGSVTTPGSRIFSFTDQ